MFIKNQLRHVWAKPEPRYGKPGNFALWVTFIIIIIVLRAMLHK